MARLAAARLAGVGSDPAPLLHQAGITSAQVDDAETEMAADAQLAFLNLAADALRDDLLGFHLAREFELRQVALLYYVLASSDTLGDALARSERYSVIANESIVLSRMPDSRAGIRVSYVGVPRHADRHQMEFWITAIVRICRHLTGSDLRPVRIAMIHPRCAVSNAIEDYLECPIAFGAGTDEIAFARGAPRLRLENADPYLNKMLVRHCEEALVRRVRPAGPLQARVENAIAPLLPHGRARVDEVARSLGMSRRTLARHLAEENLTFTDVLERVRRDMAQHYLKDPGLPISRIAWLLGYQEASAFTNSFRRWTGMTPTEMRTRHHGDATAAPP
ncbi:AraC family transcriptional regulator [Microvirga lotononidis]|uniref:DNA-binding domain-containing protein, AraC-type n=1 Tax=Microvirga lotononidis TaxID=864069 RepID=I4YZQ7_9HYPH|nr:AraC family transcriptional regulator [Microvirga lotononidis]EIM29449.1 DNA-binding domain-containing protein, AraC-type [Microvirga lotononidis]WQO27232.1 AraC family transcriptional regulator ligand-binding domain-containing protein [Microvirga lotononidis]